MFELILNLLVKCAKYRWSQISLYLLGTQFGDNFADFKLSDQFLNPFVSVDCLL